MEDNCIVKENIIRTWHIDKEVKDYLEGLCKYSGLYMREIIFQNNKYVKTLIRGNPYHIMEIDEDKLKLLTYEEIEKICENESNPNWKILKEYHKEPDEEFLGILEEYDKRLGTITNENINKKIRRRINIPSDIAKKLDKNNKNCHIYHDEEKGDVFIHFNTKKNMVKSTERINNRQLKQHYHKKS